MNTLLVHSAACRRVRTSATVADALVELSSRPGAFALESVCNTTGYGRFSILGCEPIHMLELDVGAVPAADIWRRLREAVPTAGAPADDDIPFAGGWVGWLPYEAGAELDKVHRAVAADEPPVRVRFALYDTVAVFDRANDTWSVCGRDTPLSQTRLEARLEALADQIGRSAGAAEALEAGVADVASDCPAPVSNLSRGEYLRRVERAIAYIEAGDIYQVNFTQRFTTETMASPLALYLRLRATNPADFAAFVPWDDETVICSSPELFLDVSPSGRVITRPIKGTRGRTGDPADDEAGGRALRASGKDRAELNMIIDLLRNDLGRVCAFGSVEVLEEAGIEVHPTVLHLVATIAGQLRPGVSAIDLLQAAFPGGSITGCPKIRAMQIINELEPTPRGVYCGSIGWLGLDGRLLTNIAIRTMRYAAGRVDLYAGGAITADSDPAAEYAESLAKAEGMFRALGHSTERLGDDMTGRSG